MSSPVVPKERLSAYQRWELASFDPEPEPEPETEPEQGLAVVLPTAEQVERIYQQAREEGHAVGYQEGCAQAQAEAERLRALLDDLQRELRQFDRQLAQDLLTLSLDIARQMLCQALKIRPELMLEVVREAIGCLPQFSQPGQLTLHPADAALVRARLGEQLSGAGWKILEDEQIQAGGCRLETTSSKLDATLSSRWQKVLATIDREGNWLE